MAQKRKNSNYMTEKRIADIENEKLMAERNKKKKKITIITAAILSVAIILGIIFGIGFGILGWGQPEHKATHCATIEIEGYGTLKLELYGEEAPITVENFVSLAESGFYNGLTFHKIIDSFLIQGGYKSSAELTPIKGEFSENGVENNIKHVRGTISMMHPRDFNDDATSEFFIVHKTSEENSLYLDGAYAAFGKVVSGMKIVDKICSTVTVIDKNTYEPLPANQPVIKSITIEAVK